MACRRPKSITEPAPAAEEAEVGELDLLNRPADVDGGITDLSATVGAFAARMQRRKKEQAELNDVEGQATRARQQLLLKAMVKIRRSLEEVVRIDLGDRFKLELHKDDLHGWPRLTLKLIDRVKRNDDFPSLRVVSHDRQARGAIEITYLPDQPMEQLALCKEAEFNRLPTVLKMCVRSFLDRVGEIVLSAEHPDDQDLEEAEALRAAMSAPAKAKVAPANDEQIGTTDFFDEGYSERDSFERLPELDHVDSLTTPSK